eukprot:756241_1
MRLYRYRCLDNEIAPRDITHAIVDDSVTTIKACAFFGCEHLVSILMGNNVINIESEAFSECHSLKIVRLSNALKGIGRDAFNNCNSLEVLILPLFVEMIEDWAFFRCESLRLLILPDGIDLSKVGKNIISSTALERIASDNGVEYKWGDGRVTDHSNFLVNKWLIHHKDNMPFHKLCYDSSVTAQKINDHLRILGRNNGW